MIQIYILAAFALIAMGAVLGALAIVCVGIRREEKAMSLARPAPGRIANGVRAVNGFYSLGVMPQGGVKQRPDRSVVGEPEPQGPFAKPGRGRIRMRA